jgi:DNA-directed RNA polymerase specialized sigma24 family protein
MCERQERQSTGNRQRQNHSYEEAFPEAIRALEESNTPDKLAGDADLSRNQRDCIYEYLEDPTISRIAERTGVSRPNVYSALDSGFRRLQNHVLEERSRGH